MPRKLADVVPLNHKSEQENWHAAVGDLLTERNVRGVVVTVFYKNRDYMVRHIGVRGSDLALLSAKLARLAVD